MTASNSYLIFLNEVLRKTFDYQKSTDENEKVQILNEIHSMHKNILENEYTLDQQIKQGEEDSFVETLQFFVIVQLMTF